MSSSSSATSTSGSSSVMPNPFGRAADQQEPVPFDRGEPIGGSMPGGIVEKPLPSARVVRRVPFSRFRSALALAALPLGLLLVPAGSAVGAPPGAVPRPVLPLFHGAGAQASCTTTEVC